MKIFACRVAALVAVMVAPLSAASVLQDDFNADSSSGYKVFRSNGDRDGVEFNFDYGALGIPEAPNSTDGGTTGVRMFANNPADGVDSGASAVQMVPIGVGKELVGRDYSVTYDIWMNVNGPLPGGGGGSTEAFIAGVGWNGKAGMAVGETNGTYFTITGEGGSSKDVRVFTTAGFNPDGVLVDSPNASAEYYNGIFPGGVDVGALPIQGGQDNQTGVTALGQMAFQWHEVRLDVVGNQVDFFVNDLLIASAVDSDQEGNVMLGYGDYFSSVSDAPQWSFGVVDNLSVTVVPEPSSISLLLFGLPLLRRRRSA